MRELLRGRGIAAADWEAAFARLLLDDGFRARLFAGDATALAPYRLDDAERAMLLGIDRPGVERFAASLIRKRLARLRGALPITFRAIGADLDGLVARYRSAHPSVPMACASEVRAFAEVARAWSRTRGDEWLAELIDWEATGHLAWCRDAIDAEGAVVGHLSAAAAPDAVEPSVAGSSTVFRRSPGAWLEPHARDVLGIAGWYDAVPEPVSPPPADRLVDRQMLLLRAARPGPGNRGIALSDETRAIWAAFDGETPAAQIASHVAPDVPAAAVLGMLRHLAALGLVEPVAPRRRGLVDRLRRPRDADRAATAVSVSTRPGWHDRPAPLIGIGLRRPHAALLAGGPTDGIDVLEVYAEDYAPGDSTAAAELNRLRALYPIVPHGLELSLGSVAPPDARVLAGLRATLDAVEAPYYTEHLAWTRAPEWRPGHLAPIWPTRDTIDRVAGRIEMIQAALGRPLAIENIAYDLMLPGLGIAEADLFGELVARTDCRVLLDITNLAVNAHNHRFDTDAYLRRLPLAAVVQLHLVGYTPAADGSWVDAHATTTQADVVALARRVLELGGRPAAVVLERDRDLPALTGLVDEVRDLRAALVGIGHAGRPSRES